MDQKQGRAAAAQYDFFDDDDDDFDGKPKKGGGGGGSKDGKKQWIDRYNELIEYKKITGNVNPSTSDPVWGALGNWCAKQRTKFRNPFAKKQAKLTDDQIKRMNEIGFEWERPTGGRVRETRQSTHNEKTTNNSSTTTTTSTKENNKEKEKDYDNNSDSLNGTNSPVFNPPPFRQPINASQLSQITSQHDSKPPPSKKQKLNDDDGSKKNGDETMVGSISTTFRADTMFLTEVKQELHLVRMRERYESEIQTLRQRVLTLEDKLKNAEAVIGAFKKGATTTTDNSNTNEKEVFRIEMSDITNYWQMVEDLCSISYGYRPLPGMSLESQLELEKQKFNAQIDREQRRLEDDLIKQQLEWESKMEKEREKEEIREKQRLQRQQEEASNPTWYGLSKTLSAISKAQQIGHVRTDNNDNIEASILSLIASIPVDNRSRLVDEDVIEIESDEEPPAPIRPTASNSTTTTNNSNKLNNNSTITTTNTATTTTTTTQAKPQPPPIRLPPPPPADDDIVDLS